MNRSMNKNIGKYKTVLITGANHGLGLSLVNVFLENGFTVFAGVYHRVDTSQIAMLKGKDNINLIDLDISDLDSVKKAASFIGSITQSLDIVINNAGIITPDDNTLFDELDFESIRREMDVNAIGALRVANVFSHLLKEGEKKLLVNISSEAGSISDCERNTWFGYCMSKAALNMMGALIHNELKKIGGQVLLIHPGFMQTYMHGVKNEAATYSPDFSAKHIFEQIQKAEENHSEKAIYIDLFGEKLNW